MRSNPWAAAPAVNPPNSVLVPRGFRRIVSPRWIPDASKAARSVFTAEKTLVSCAIWAAATRTPSTIRMPCCGHRAVSARPQLEQHPHLVGGRQWPAQLRGDTGEPGDELRVALGQLAFAIPDVVLQPRADVTAHRHCRHPQWQLRAADAADGPMGARRDHLDQVEELLDLRQAAATPSTKWKPERAARAVHRRSGARHSRCDRARNTRSRFHPVSLHAGGQLPQEDGRVDEDAFAEVDRPAVE